MAEAAAEAGLEQFKHQTWVLKVPIHCGGCKKQVKKILRSIDGVYTTDVDSQLQKVTVTGTINAETLIKKLVKRGKHAELWPEKPKKEEAKPAGNQKSNKQNVPKNEETAKNKSEEKPEESAKKGEGSESKEVAEKNGVNEGDKKKKEEKGNSSVDNGSSGNEVGGTGYPPPVLNPYCIPPPQAMPQYPPVYYMPSPHALSYSNVAHPSTSSSYYVRPVYAYTYSAAPSFASAPSPNSANDFSDEECGCSVM